MLAALLTATSFYVVYTHLIWAPAIPIALAVLAIAQIGVHLVFFLHLTTAPDNTNNVLALAFGVLIVALIIGGSVWIMNNLNDRMMPTMQQMMHDAKSFETSAKPRFSDVSIMVNIHQNRNFKVV